jgi:acetylornithine deacetylase/succinyl-diaminopimelate desuccinylase-like protein
MISGGIDKNTLPSRCVLTIDSRVTPGETAQARLKKIEDVCSRSGRDDLEIRVLGAKDSSYTRPDSHIVLELLKSIKAILGIDAKPAGFPAGCDMRYLANQAHVPTVIFGPGSLDVAHKADEYVPIDELIDSAAIYEELAKRILAPAG